MSHEEDDVQALKREVELLKTLLSQEREKSESARERGPSLTRPASPAKSTGSKNAPLLSSSSKPELRPRQPPVLNNNDSSTAGQRGRSLRWSAANRSGQPPTPSTREPLLALEHVPVDTKRGKWWLKDRQILSRNTPSPSSDCIAVKVRETWLWSGRTVVVDKIVTCPQAIDERCDSVDVTHNDASENEDAELERSQIDSVRDSDVETDKRPKEAQSSQETPAASPPAVTPSRSTADATQLAQAFQLPGASAITVSDQREDASARMELQMAVAEKEVGAAERE